MGNKPARPLPDAWKQIQQQAAQVQRPAPALGPLLCDVRKTELSTLKRDVNRKQTEVDSCSPEEKRARMREALTTEFTEFRNKRTDEFNKELEMFEKYIQMAKNAQMAQKPLEDYSQELQTELQQERTELVKYERDVRAGRRRFLDNDPQEQVSNVLGIYTTDDKILLGFWIVYLLLIAVATFVLIAMYGEKMGLDSMGKKAGMYGFMIATCYGIAYFFIYKFA
jgi:hypothetical protein